MSRAKIARSLRPGIADLCLERNLIDDEEAEMVAKEWTEALRGCALKPQSQRSANAERDRRT